MTTESPPRPYDVWRMSFEYEDQPGVAKVRPVVIGAGAGGGPWGGGLGSGAHAKARRRQENCRPRHRAGYFALSRQN